MVRAETGKTKGSGGGGGLRPPVAPTAPRSPTGNPPPRKALASPFPKKYLRYNQKVKKDFDMMYSPLEQFAIISLIPFHIGNFYFSFTNSSLFMLLTTGFFLLLFYFVTVNGGNLVPSRWQSFVEMIYEFVANLVEEQVGQKGKKYFPLIFTIFTFLLFSNLIGMIPYSFTTTSHLIVTFSLSVSIFIAVTIIGFQIHGIHFLVFYYHQEHL